MKTTKMLGKFGGSWRNLVPDGLKFAMFLVLGAAMLPMAAEAAGLVEALEEHNSASGSTTIYLEPGNSSCARGEIALAQGMDDKRLSCRSR